MAESVARRSQPRAAMPRPSLPGDGWTKASGRSQWGGLTYRDCGGYGEVGGKQVQVPITRAAYMRSRKEASDANWTKSEPLRGN